MILYSRLKARSEILPSGNGFAPLKRGIGAERDLSLTLRQNGVLTCVCAPAVAMVSPESLYAVLQIILLIANQTPR
jgi:hypothetical protein